MSENWEVEYAAMQALTPEEWAEFDDQEVIGLLLQCYRDREGFNIQEGPAMAPRREITARMKGPQWHHISKAPMDGRDLLACVWYPRRVIDVGPNQIDIPGQYEICMARYIDNMWMDDEGSRIEAYFPITHWMALPEPPEEPTDETN